MYTLSNMHYNAEYVSIDLLVFSLLCFFAYYAVRALYDSKRLKGLTEELALRLCNSFILVGVLLLLAFILYYSFIWRPDAVQAEMNNMTRLMGEGNLPVIQRLV